MSVEEALQRRHVPSFGAWEYCEDPAMAQYCDSYRCGYGGGFYDRSHLYPPLPCYYYSSHDEDLYTAPPPVYPRPRKAKRDATLEKQLRQLKQVVKENEFPSPAPARRARQARVFDCEIAAQESIRRQRAVKAVDEDLYKIPPELLRRKHKKKPATCDFWSSCLGINCVV